MRKPRIPPTLRLGRPPKSVDQDCSRSRCRRAAERAKYGGSPYHKRGAGGVGRGFKFANKCDKKWDADTATTCLKKALESCQVSADWRGDFPRNVWYVDEGTAYEAVLTNQESGEYHAYPIHREEWPQGLSDE